MALEGNLNSFGLSEILQLIAVQQKTGMLTVSADDKSIVMFFRDGQIISTRDRRRRARDPFKEYLTRYGVLNRDDLIRISQIASQSKLDFTDILSSEGFLGEEEILVQWRKQIQESMHEMLTWDQCTYKFISNEEIVDGIRSLAQYNIEAMLMESMRRIDEFPQMLKMFPRDDVLITRIDNGEVALQAQPDVGVDDDDDDGRMTTNERQIYGLLTEILSLRDLIARGKMPVYEVYESLKLLKDRGLIKVKDEQPATGEVRAREEESSDSRRRIRNVLPFIVAMGILGAAGVFGFRDTVTGVLAGEVPALHVTRDASLERARLEHNLRWLIEAFRAREGYYPADLQELRTKGLASQAVLEAAEELEFRYRLTSSGAAYTLL